MDLFCGTGGFSKGFERSGGFEVVYGIDLLRLSVDTFKLNHPNALGVHGDIRKISRREVADWLRLGPGSVDIIIGGPPCQGFSSIRPNRSINYEDPRNSLFEEFAAYVGYWHPKVFVFENVVGLATHRQGADLDAVQEAFARQGYETDWRVINAAHFGVPQKRERLILIGAEPGIPIIWPKPTHGGRFKTIGIREHSRMLLPNDEDNLHTVSYDELPPAITVLEAIGDLPPIASGEATNQYTMPPLTQYQVDRRRNSAQLLNHDSTRHSSHMMEIIRHSGPNISCIPAHLISSGFSSCYSRLDANEPSPTITVNFIHPASNRCIHPNQDRALTPREGARLQSFDDDFKFAGKNRAAIAKQIGNAVPPLLGRALGQSISLMLE